MSKSGKNRKQARVNHIFVSPEVTTYPKPSKSGGGYPPTEIKRDENEETLQRQHKGIKNWLQEIVTETKAKELKDDMAYFVVDFKIRADHPSSAQFIKKLQAKPLTFLDSEKVKVLVASEVKTLENVVKTVEFSASMKKIVYDIRPLKLEEQIEKRAFLDKSWVENPKFIDIFVVPNIDIDRTEKYLSLAKSFLEQSSVETLDIFIDKLTMSGMVSAKIDFPTTSKLLKSSSFVYKILETPRIRVQSLVPSIVGDASQTTDEITEAYQVANQLNQSVASLPIVCVIDTGLNTIKHLQNLVVQKSSEPNMLNNLDYDDHGTPVAYLVAYGEGYSPRARIISHKILSGSRGSNLFAALGRAMQLYLQRTRIFTCSINFEEDSEASRFETWKIDRIAQASNACVLFSAGNIDTNSIRAFISRGLSYPKYLDSNPVMLPSNSVSVMAVGSYCRKSNGDQSIAPSDSPSPFTRYNTGGLLMCCCIKPEVVEHGGNLNCNFSCAGVGVETVSSAGFPVQKVGTSFSTPIMAGHIAEVIHKYGSRIHNAETLKAIACSSCTPTQNYSKFVGFGKPDREEMLYSSFQSAKIIFEGTMRLSHPHFKESYPASKISVYVPAGVDNIELVLVHSDDYSFQVDPGLYTYIEVVPEKPARESPPPPDRGELRGREHVKKLVWNYEKAVRGFWFFTLVPHHIGIPNSLREGVTLRYGGVLKLTTNRPRSTPLADEVKRNLNEKTND